MNACADAWRRWFTEFGKEAVAEFDLPAEIYKEGQFRHTPRLRLSGLERTGADHKKNKCRYGDPLDAGKTSGCLRSAASGLNTTYDVEEVENAGDVTIGDAINDADVIARLTEAAIRRESTTGRREPRPEMVFWSAGRCGGICTQQDRPCARRSILIVDPYFSTPGLMAFGHATRRADVELRILTSADGLKEMAKDDSNLNAGIQLQKGSGRDIR